MFAGRGGIHIRRPAVPFPDCEFWLCWLLGLYWQPGSQLNAFSPNCRWNLQIWRREGFLFTSDFGLFVAVWDSEKAGVKLRCGC